MTASPSHTLPTCSYPPPNHLPANLVILISFPLFSLAFLPLFSYSQASFSTAIFFYSSSTHSYTHFLKTVLPTNPTNPHPPYPPPPTPLTPPTSCNLPTHPTSPPTQPLYSPNLPPPPLSTHLIFPPPHLPTHPNDCNQCDSQATWNEIKFFSPCLRHLTFMIFGKRKRLHIRWNDVIKLK